MLGFKPAVKVRKIGSNLVAGFHRANPPMIWKFDLERNHSFTIGLQGEDNASELGLTSPKGDFYVIARFNNHEDAECAFNAVQKGLMQHRWTQLLPAFPKTISGWLGLVLLVMIAVVLWETVKASSAIGMAHTLANVPAAMQPPAKIGIPQSADDILKPPRAQ